MKVPDNPKYILFGGTFVLANKLQAVGDKAATGLSVKQWFLLRNISELPAGPSPSITQIANAMDSTRQNITKMLDVLVRDGYVCIEPDAHDHRSRTVSLTEKAQKYLAAAPMQAQTFFDALYKDIGDSELQAASRVLAKMVQNLEEMR